MTRVPLDLFGIQRRLVAAQRGGAWSADVDNSAPRGTTATGPMRLHRTKRGAVQAWQQASLDAEFIRNAPADIAALIAEVEYLRGTHEHD